jgi:hypothetical protein
VRTGPAQLRVRLRFAHLLFALIAVLVPAAARKACAQTCPNNAPLCVGTDGRIIIAPPSPTVQDPNAQAQAEARARAEAEARWRAQQQAALQAEIDRVLAWKVYLSWQLRARAEAEAAAAMRLEAAARANATRSWNAWAVTPLPALGAHPDRVITYPRGELMLLTPCAAVFSGRDLPSYKGICLPFRVRFDDSWSAVLDASFLFERYRDTDFHTVGIHPAVAYSFAVGHGTIAGSHAYVRAGVDGQLPIDGASATADAYVGAHTGLGVQAQLGDVAGIGLELRGLVRGGTNSADDGISRARLGAEIRVHLLSLAW